MYRACLLLLLTSALAFSQSSDADALFQQQDWAGAAREFAKVTTQDPHNGPAWFRMATSLHHLGRNAEARGAYQKAIDNRFQAPAAMAAVARSYAHDGDPVKAAEWLDRAAKIGFSGLALVDSDPDFGRIKSDPAFIAARGKVDRNAHPCSARPEYSQFSFWLGEWDVQVSGQTIAHSRIEKLLEGCVIQENWMPFSGVEGKSWNFYDHQTGKWEQVWMSAGNTLKLAGSFQDGAMRFEGSTAQASGQTTLERLTFTPMSEGRVHQFWEQSRDGGKTWTSAFDGVYIPRKKT